MAWRLGKTDQGPGMYLPLLAETEQKGVDVIVENLNGYYSQSASNRGLVFQGAKGPTRRGLRRKLTWKNRVYEQIRLHTVVNVVHWGSREDSSPPPPRRQQLYLVFFNVEDADEGRALRLSMRERDHFMDYYVGHRI